MARLILAAERITRARALIQKARELPVPPGGSRFDFSYVAEVKDLLRQARDLVKFIPKTAGVSDETKEQVRLIFAEADQVDRGSG
jgi:hypothetical protein